MSTTLEALAADHVQLREWFAHLCGHDGRDAMLLAAGR